MYFISLPFQLLTTGAVLQQGSTALVALTALHAGIVAGLFWALLGNAIVSTQVVEDGTLSSLIVRPPSALHSPPTRRVGHCSLFVADITLPRTDSHCVSSPLLSSELQPISLWTWPYRYLVLSARPTHQALYTASLCSFLPACGLARKYSNQPISRWTYRFGVGSAAILFFVMMTWIVLAVLREVRPLWFYVLAATLFVLSQVDYFLLNKVCDLGISASI